jgi:hypothetical protein
VRAWHQGPNACSHQLTLQFAAAIPQYETQQQTNQLLFSLCLHLKHQQKNPSFVISPEECPETHPCSKSMIPETVVVITYFHFSLCIQTWRRCNVL